MTEGISLLYLGDMRLFALILFKQDFPPTYLCFLHLTRIQTERPCVKTDSGIQRKSLQDVPLSEFHEETEKEKRRILILSKSASKGIQCPWSLLKESPKQTRRGFLDLPHLLFLETQKQETQRSRERESELERKGIRDGSERSSFTSTEEKETSEQPRDWQHKSRGTLQGGHDQCIRLTESWSLLADNLPIRAIVVLNGALENNDITVAQLRWLSSLKWQHGQVVGQSRVYSHTLGSIPACVKTAFYPLLHVHGPTTPIRHLKVHIPPNQGF
ncbi:hypothetical protein VNO77_34001 [Canavalia gladiata]|uniref:Uncharacterized protein n=1 Tax=Canavalia gladiata TaxID=3824 RepID=A0AAN9PZG3_CANGL